MSIIKRNLVSLAFCFIVTFFYVFIISGKDVFTVVLPLNELNVNEGYWDFVKSSRPSTTSSFSLRDNSDVICCFKVFYDHKMYNRYSGRKVVVYWQDYKDEFIGFDDIKIAVKVDVVNKDGSKNRVISYRDTKRELRGWEQSIFVPTTVLFSILLVFGLKIITTEIKHRKLNNDNK